MNRCQEKHIEKYLNQWAEPEARILAFQGKTWDLAIVLPCYGEANLLPGFLQSLVAAQQKTGLAPLLVVVINRKEHDHILLHTDSEAALSLFECHRAIQDIGFWGTYRNIDCLVVDRHRLPFPQDQGVGLARKLGCDLALTLWATGAIRSPWIRTTDADVRLPTTYLHEEPSAAGVVVVNQRFAHKAINESSPTWKALQVYEIFLRYYVMGLRFAGSTYAHQTIGSTIVVHADAYAKVRGFPKRLAGEDFHLINKLAKIGNIATSQQQPLIILDRPSNRVPFGTGAAVAKITDQWEKQKEYLLYHPRCFELLKIFLTNISQERPLYTRINKRASLALDQALNLSSHHATLSKQKKFHTWFDGLKQLRFLHTVRDHVAPSLPVKQALEKAPFIPTIAADMQLTQLLQSVRRFDEGR